ncbi:MAG: phosphatidylglycerophosphatase A [Peptoniphilus sp.]|nr:phosphatidylglycerophosphatase A [Peptoniphilus sp.]
MEERKELCDIVVEALENIGVNIEDLVVIVYDLQRKYNEDISMEDCEENLLKVFEKREVINTVLTGLAIDKMVQEGKFPEPIQSVIKRDDGLYGVDEILPLGIVNLYGTIGLTNFGYLDKEKPGVINEIDQRKKDGHQVTTFTDDILAAIVAAAAARIAHGQRLQEENK